MKNPSMLKSMGLCSALLASVWTAETVAQPVPELVRPDGSYPTVPLEKDVVVLKVVQNEPMLLQEAESVELGLKENVRRMGHWINKACT